MSEIRLPKVQRWVLRHWLPLVVVLLMLAALFALGDKPLRAQEGVADGTEPTATEEVQISAYLSAQLEASASEVPILILLRDQPDLEALKASTMSASANSALSAEARRAARADSLYQALTAHALQSQAALRAWLDAEGIPYRAHYIINMIRVTGDAELVERLRQRSDVARLDADPQVDVMHGTNATVATWTRILQLPEAISSPNVPYGITATRAPEVWAMGYTGQGITVASQDTGVQWDHPALRPHYRGTNGETVEHDYNWLNAIPESENFDACEGIDSPCDDNGHGTHTVGTMVGTSEVITYGVAPDAQWMGCRNMRGGVGTPESYTTCFEFFMAPYPPDGDPFTDGRTEFAPDVINNSWGCPPSEGCSKEALRQIVETVRAAGIMVVASAGNGGAGGCSTTVDPIGIYDATFTVGAHDVNGNLAVFSSRGPVTADGSGRLKPDLTAPGVGVLSTSRFSNTTTLSGTSMASPHVAGAVALLWSAASWLVGDPDMTEQVLLKSAGAVYSSTDEEDPFQAHPSRCGNTPPGVSPNPAFGYGRLDVAAAVEMALRPWNVTVAISDSVQAPVAGAQVIWVDERTGYTYTTTTSISGTATITPMLAGVYTLEVVGEAGALQMDDVALVNDGTAEEPQAMRIDFLYDETLIPYPEQIYLPDILAN